MRVSTLPTAANVIFLKQNFCCAIDFAPVTEYKIPDMFLQENNEFIKSITTGEKCRNHIDYVLESAKLLDGLYKSAEINKEISF